MECPFAIEDVFAAGIGFDIAGAWFLSRGLIATPTQIRQEGAMVYDGNYALWARGVGDRVDAVFGLGWLGVTGLVMSDCPSRLRHMPQG